VVVKSLFWLTVAVVLSAVFAVSGCVTQPDAPALDRGLPVAWQNPGLSRTDDASTTVTTWWSAFGNPQLDELVRLALAQNLTLAIAGERVSAARALAAHGSDLFRPTVSFRAAPAASVETTANFYQAGFDARWELGLFGQQQGVAEMAVADAGIALAREHGARVTLVADVVRAWIGVRAGVARLDALDAALGAARKSADLNGILLRTGQISALLAHQSLDAEDALISSRAQQRALLDNHSQQLALLIGRTSIDPGWLAERTPLSTDASLDATPADLLRYRPDIAEAEQAVLRAAGDAGLARAALYPHLSLVGTLGYSMRVSGTSATRTQGLAAFGPVIDIPLFDWGWRRAVVDARDADLRAAVLAYRQAVLEGYAEAQSALGTFSAQRERAAALRSTLERRVQETRAAEKLATLGRASELDIWAARSHELAAQIDLSECDEAVGQAFIAFYKAMGGAPLPATEAAG